MWSWRRDCAPRVLLVEADRGCSSRRELADGARIRGVALPTSAPSRYPKPSKVFHPERIRTVAPVSSAFFSPCRTWRYSLTRDVAPLTGEGTCTFIGLNPSTADETQDDPTIRRCIDFARRWGFARLKMLNLFALRSTDPRGLLTADDPVGPENDCTISKVVGGSDLIICAWGVFPPDGRVKAVLEFVAAPHCLGLTKPNGEPRWCFVCRKRVRFTLTVHTPTDPMSYYGPHATIECERGHTDGDCFPGTWREWGEP
jgi:hypothetical protein